MTENKLHETLKSLSLRRPIFHSEADFQHELAIELVNYGYQVRLEVPRDIHINGSSVKAEIDVLIHDGRIWTAIELKYVKKATSIEHGGETFQLKGTWGTNLSRFDCLADSQRIEAIVATGHANVGYSVFLTNAADAWNNDISRTQNMAKFFSIHDGRVIFANTPVDWHPAQPLVGSVSAKRLTPYSPILLNRKRTIRWHDYSFFESNSEVFKYLIL